MYTFSYKQDCTIKYLVAGEPTNPPLVLVHGTQTSATHAFGTLIHGLCKDYQLFILETPGFGISGFPNHDKGLSVEGVFDIYTDIMDAFLAHVQKDKVYLLGHSFGGLVCAHFAKQRPTKVNALVLCNVCGLLPTLSEMGFYWGVFFKLYPIQRLFNIVRPLVLKTADFCSTNISFWDAVSGDEMTGPRALSKCIFFDSCHARWTTPFLPTVLETRVPISIIWGEADCIIPIDHGQLLLDTLDSEKIKLYIIRGEGHNPFRTKNYTHVVRDALSNATLPGDKAPILAKKIKESVWPFCGISINPYKNKKTIENVYKHVHDMTDTRAKKGSTTLCF